MCFYFTVRSQDASDTSLVSKKTGTKLPAPSQKQHNTIFERGVWERGYKTGIWEYYDHNQQLSQKYDHTKDELIYFRPYPEERYFDILTDSGWAKIQPDRPPMFIGGKNRLVQHLLINLSYPRIAAIQGISGVVIISFVINKNGKAGHYMVEKAIGGGCEEAAIKAVKMLPQEWIPAKLEDESVDAKYFLPITFN